LSGECLLVPATAERFHQLDADVEVLADKRGMATGKQPDGHEWLKPWEQPFRRRN